MNKREKYVEALKSLNGWVEISVWGEQVSKMFPELLKEAEDQAREQKNDTTGQAEINDRLSSYLAGGSFPEVEVDKTASPKKVRYISGNIEDKLEENEDTFDKDSLEEEKHMSTTNAQKYYDTYRDAGFHFPTSILTTYALSLHTKPFVLLSGISGTGKTKIAQLFKTVDDVAVKTNTNNIIIPEDLLFITVRDTWINGDGRTNFKYKILSALLTEDEISLIEPLRQEYLSQGKTNQYSPLYDFIIETPDGKELSAQFYLQRPKNPLVRIRFKSKRGASNQYDTTEYFKENYEHGDIVEFQRISNKRLRIIENTQNNIEEFDKELEAKEVSLINRKCFIPVRSDWTDSTELFGHYNMIEKKYHLTKLLKFILEAQEHPDYPFFVILDEMNLSKVEHYFSDFLSCLESRYYDNNGNLVQESINLYDMDDLMETDDMYFDLIPSAIELPKNLYITGTVNIDESTYMFSPKVLDRANVIEFNTVDLLGYGTGEYKDEEDYKLTSFPDFTELSLATKKIYDELPKLIKDHLVAINVILEKYNLHFGYRTANEVALYIHNAMKHIDDNDEVRLRALDYQLIQKVFSKLNGGYAVLEEPLREVLLYLSDQTDLQKVESNNSKFPRTIKKLQRLYDKLSKNGYASFID